MIRLSSKRIHQLLAMAVCLALLLTGFLSIYSVNNVRVQAAGTITVYFDTSCVGKDSSHGWSKTMSKVYYHAYKGSTGTGLKEMTAIGKDGKDGGKLFSASVDTSKYSSIIFSSKSSWSSGTDKLTQTKSYSLSGLADNSIFILNTSGYNEGTSVVQGMYVGGTYKEEEAVDYAKKTFSILNMTSSKVTLKLRFTDEVKTDGVWSGSFTISSDTASYELDARNYYYSYFSVPSSGDSKKPYSTVEIQNASGDVLNKYYFAEGKILGRTYEYGVSQLSSRVISYQHANPVKTYAIDNVLYLDKKSVTEAGAVVDGKTTTAVNKNGNALYMTSEDVSNEAFDGESGTSSKKIDLSAQIFSMTYGGNTYNLFGPENDGDNLIIINDNVATVSGKYTTQSTDNVLNGQKYITVNADMYDYQYDHNSQNDSSYSYYVKDKARVQFTDNKGWGNIKAYFFGGSYNDQKWPGDSMSYVGTNSYGQSVYETYLPLGATTVIFNGNNGQTVDINYADGKQYYPKDDKDSSGHYYVDSVGISGASASNEQSQLGNAKRPYLAINEKISSSPYGSTKYPMYLGQFWLPNVYNDSSFDTSSEMYTSVTASRQRAGHNADGDMYYVAKDSSDPNDHSQTSGYYMNFGFGKILNNFKWAANLAYRTDAQDAGTYKPYNAVAQGLVNKKLVDGKLMDPSGTYTIPYFDPSWWTGTFKTSQGKTVNMEDYITKYEGLDFPFFEIDAEDIDFRNKDYSNKKLLSDRNDLYEGKYYLFDSKAYVVKVNPDNSLEKYNKSDVSSNLVYDNYGDNGSGKHDSTGELPGLFPFNSRSQGGANSTQLHYGYGIKYTIDFYFNENGTVDGTPDGIPITFTFQGDDDVWVFLDDILLLDMGGAHKNALGEINFRTKNAWISAAGDASDTSIVANNTDGKPEKSYDFSKIDAKYLAPGKHTITMYYMERGMLNSNLYVMFNLPMSLTKLELQEDTDFTAVNNGFKKATMTVADQDVFNYYVENKGTTNVVGSDYVVPSTESVVRSNGDLKGSIETELGSGSGTAHTNNFSTTRPDEYSPFGKSNGSEGASYQLADIFADKKVNYDTRALDGGKHGVISMQYGELATINKQFNYGSSMRVTQLDKLSVPDGRSSNSYDDSVGRKVSDYYNTFTKSTANDDNSVMRLYAGIYNGDDLADTDLDHAQTMYGEDGKIKEDNPNYSMHSVVNLQESVSDKGVETTYNFNDPTNAANEYVHLRQVVINEVKTYSLTFRKMLENGDPPGNENFSFKIKFSDVFGANRDSSDDAIEYNKISYLKYVYDAQTGEWAEPRTSSYLTNIGTFTLSAYDYIVISGIPAGTKYTISELKSENNQRYVLDTATSMNLDGQLFGNIDSIAYNKIKTGNVEITKSVDGEDDGDYFPISFRLTKIPEGLDLTKYSIMYSINDGFDEVESGAVVDDPDNQKNYLTDLANKRPIVYYLSNGQTLAIEGLPYGCEYEVEEDLGGLCYYNEIGYSDENRVIDDQILDATFANPVYADPPIDNVYVINHPLILKVEKKVIIDKTEVNPEIYVMIDESKVKDLEFDLTVEGILPGMDPEASFEPQAEKSYVNVNVDVDEEIPVTDYDGKFTIKNDYGLDGRQKDNAPEIDVFSKQFELGTKLRITEDADEAFTPSYYYLVQKSGTSSFVKTADATMDVKGHDSYLVENTLNTASLTVTKNLTKPLDVDELEFTFDIHLFDVAGHDLTNGNEVVINKTIKLTKGQTSASITIDKIPVNTSYIVEEKNIPDGYIMQVTDLSVNSKKLSPDGGEVTVTNKKIEVIEMPETGVPFIFHPFVIGISAIILAAAALIIYKKRLRAAALYTNGKGRYKD